MCLPERHPFRNAFAHRMAAICFALAAGTAALLLGRTAAAAPPVEFNRDVRAIISNNCYQCHGPDAKSRPAGLRLDQREGALATLETGNRAVVPGDLSASEMVKRIQSTDPDVMMPPPSSGKSLKPEQIEVLKTWISQGAEYQGHWSFVPPVRKPAPQVSAPVANEIDNFVIAKLDAAGLKPSPEADRTTLIRRLSLDLTGLPPTPEEVDAFLADSSHSAYETLVDRLLASPRYGEHMGRYWLDAARYGDTHGLHLDNERSLWPYREWVISAFNRNLPFDQFTVEQLAGDMLPNPSRDQRVATGFNRCNVSTSEGGAIDEEWLVRYAVDRVEVTGTVWMGLTLGCAVCHSHKFDPISQKEFYSLYAFFNSLADNAMDGNALLPPPSLKLPSEMQKSELESLEQQLAQANQQIGVELSRLAYRDPIEDSPAVSALTAISTDLVWFEDDLPSGASPQHAGHPWQFVTPAEGPVFAGARSTKRTGDGVIQHFFTGANPEFVLEAGDVLFGYAYLDPANPPKAVMLQFNDGSWDHRAHWGDNSIGFGQPGTSANVEAGGLPPAGQWVRLEIPIQRVGLAAGSKLNGLAFTQFGGTVYWDHAGVRRANAASSTFESLWVWEESFGGQVPASLPAHVQAILKTARDQRSADQNKQLQDYFVQNVCDSARPIFRPLVDQVAKVTKQRNDLDGLVPATLVSEDLAKPRDAFVLIRGQYDKRGEQVERGVPASLPPLPEGVPVNRLGLAKWLTDPGHPLTARVTVNRYWQQYFGTGLVKTSEDFGTQGQKPTNPELLDWLATEFIRTGWDVKRMQKLIVMSNTYRQASRVTPDLLQRDPANELLARGPRFRVDAEVIRDGALLASGLLVEQNGGKSVRTYQPDGIWEAVGFVSSNTRNFTRDNGNSLFRRSLYTFWKRTAPPPNMMTFDAPSRESCTVRRPRTNTPLQALVLMNDEQYVEAARSLAEITVTHGGPDTASRLAFAFRRCTSRLPNERELGTLQTILDRQMAEFTAHPEAAEKLLGVGTMPKPATMAANELAAYTMLANLMLNLDEAVTKE